jgi:hypothetical protein
MLFVRFPAREAAPSGAPDSARALDCGAADFYFGKLAATAELGGSFATTGWQQHGQGGNVVEPPLTR